MKNIHMVMDDLKVLKKEFIDRKLYLKDEIIVVNKKIDALNEKNKLGLLNENENKNFTTIMKELQLEKDKIKKELKIFYSIDNDNKFSYEMLGYTIYGYDKACERMNEFNSNETEYIKQKLNEYEFDVAGKTEVEIQDETFEGNCVKTFLSKFKNLVFAYKKCNLS